MRHSENNTNFTVKYCTKCNHAWERDCGKCVIYLDFPSYGLQRKTCGICTEKLTRQSDILSEIESIRIDNMRDTL